jgi:hypothetical protein
MLHGWVETRRHQVGQVRRPWGLVRLPACMLPCVCAHLLARTVPACSCCLPGCMHAALLPKHTAFLLVTNSTSYSLLSILPITDNTLLLLLLLVCRLRPTACPPSGPTVAPGMGAGKQKLSGPQQVHPWQVQQQQWHGMDRSLSGPGNEGGVTHSHGAANQVADASYKTSWSMQQANRDKVRPCHTDTLLTCCSSFCGSASLSTGA